MTEKEAGTALPENTNANIKLNVSIDLEPRHGECPSIRESIIDEASRQIAENLGKDVVRGVKDRLGKEILEMAGAIARPQIEKMLAEGIPADHYSGREAKTVNQLAVDFLTKPVDNYGRGKTNLQSITADAARAELNKAAKEFAKELEKAKKELREQFKEKLSEEALSALSRGY